MANEALAVKRDVLFRQRHFQGFFPRGEEFKSLILNNYFFGVRTPEFEHDAQVKQIIPYTVLVNPNTDQVFAYRRASNERCSDARLRNKWSIGVGGHIQRQDEGDLIERGMMRELHEEIVMEQYPKPRLIGCLNCEEDVEEYHFALLFLAQTTCNITIGDGEISECGFHSADELERLLDDDEYVFEEWSRIAWPIIRERYLKRR